MNQIPILNAKDIYFDIYNLLWTRADKRNGRNFQCLVPDTIVFVNDMPVSWVFTSKKDGVVKKKIPSKVKLSEIINSFMKKNQNILAYYMYSSQDNKKIEYIVTGEAEKIESLNLIDEYISRLGINFEDKKKNLPTLLFEIIEKKDFVNFMNNTKKRYGVLQLYKETSEIYNYMFRILWSPQFSICDMRKSRQPFLSKNSHIYEKAITFETEKFNQKTGKK